MKKLISIIVLVATLFTNLTVLAKEFPDVPKTNPHFAAIDYLSSQGVLTGYSDGKFKPDQLVNRAEALKIIFVGIKTKIDATLKTSGLFTDVKGNEWFAKYLAYAKSKGIISGNPDGTYAPARTVERAEFVKMLLNAIGFKKDQWTGQNLFADVPKDAWFNPFMNYAGKSGLITPDSANKVYPGKKLTRGEVSEIVYLMLVIVRGKDTQFLITQSESQMALVEGYIGASNLASAKRAAELAVDMTQQAYKNMPTDNIVLGAAKLARCYDYLVTSFVYALQKDYVNAKTYADKVMVKAAEAIKANKKVTAIANHLKDRAAEIESQIPKV